MSGLLLVLVTLVYAAIAVEQFYLKHPSMGIVFAGYALANIGLLLAIK